MKPSRQALVINARESSIQRIIAPMLTHPRFVQCRERMRHASVTSVEASDVPRLVEVWEAAVRATHHFLSEADIQNLKPLIEGGLLGQMTLGGIRDADGGLIGFVGIAQGNIEALFVHPQWHRTGVGRRLVEHAAELGAWTVDVNEQNTEAVAFYHRLGFKVIGRSETDGLGNPFPLLHLQRGPVA